MAGRPPNPRPGRALKAPPTGFPLFCDGRKPRVVTADPWAFVSHLAVRELPREEERVARAYIDQAFDFFEAAGSPQLGSKPLLYYYSFLNLAKAALLVRRVRLPPRVVHGISDPKANRRSRLRLEGQTVRWEARAPDHSAIFPELLVILGTAVARPRTMKIKDLLRQIPSIHRTFSSVAQESPSILPVKRFDFLRDQGSVWVRMVLKRDDKDVDSALPVLRGQRAFSRLFHVVRSSDDDELWFESTVQTGGRGRGIDRGLSALAASARALGGSCVLTSIGYRFYLNCLPPGQRIPAIAAAYAVLFYLGSVTRYKPYDFDRIIEGGYSWVVEEFLATQPQQFIYGLASELAGVDVVRPYAIT